MMFRAGDMVVVRSRDEILASLDDKGRLEGVPFMPQMFQYCGQRFRVYKRAHKTCDTVNDYKGRKVASAVHLDTRCDGEHYGGCQASCLIFWKEAWLKPAGEGEPEATPTRPEATAGDSREARVWGATTQGGHEGDGQTRYSCQATLLPTFTEPLPWWDLRQYLEDYRSGNVTLGQMAAGFLYAGFYLTWRRVSAISWRGGQYCCRLYDLFQKARGGHPFPRRGGAIPGKQPTPHSELNLQPGDTVRVKTYEEILATLDTDNKNHGLYFDAEMVPYCGGTYRVRTRLTKFLDEKTGKLITTRQPAIILENVWCRSRYSDCRLFCPRSIFPWWREVWLERV